jgi:hypothetical protein
MHISWIWCSVFMYLMNPVAQYVPATDSCSHFSVSVLYTYILLLGAAFTVLVCKCGEQLSTNRHTESNYVIMVACILTCFVRWHHSSLFRGVLMKNKLCGIWRRVVCIILRPWRRVSLNVTEKTPQRYCNTLPIYTESIPLEFNINISFFEQHRSSTKCIIVGDNVMKCLPSALYRCPFLWVCIFLHFIIPHVYWCVYFIEMELNIVLQAVLYLNTSDLQYNLCTVLLTVRLAALKTKFLTELLAVPNLTLTNHTQFNELKCWWHDLRYLLIAYCAAL